MIQIQPHRHLQFYLRPSIVHSPTSARSGRNNARQRVLSIVASSSSSSSPPLSLPPPPQQQQQRQGQWLQKALAITALSTSLALSPYQFPGTHHLEAQALLSSPSARQPRSPEAALRRSIPAFNLQVKEIQQKLESVQFKLRIPQRKPWAAMQDDVAVAARMVGTHPEEVLQGVLAPDRPQAIQLVQEIQSDLDRLSTSISLKDTDRTSVRVANALERLSALELLQAPGLPYRLPQQYSDLPILTGRATIEFTVEKASGKAVFVNANSEQGPAARAVIAITVDGYSAPITAGNFVRNVQMGVYANQKLLVNQDAIQIGAQGTSIGALPLELMASDDFEPSYRIPLSVQSGEFPVLPLSIYGSVAMTHLPGADASVGFVSSRQFFIYKYQRQASGLAGLSFDEGNFGVFGYVTKGAELLNKLEPGDVVVGARVADGAEKLRLPTPNGADTTPTSSSS